MGRNRYRFSAAILLAALLFISFILMTIKTTPSHRAGILKSPSSTRRDLLGPGSAPPTCRSKCGKCTPCKAVHVPIQPGVSMPLEYYPEAWRCKCGNKLYMP
ncbi:EPIDERMAL PATTERNING FACTOR-like protein 4 [Silene latifolia]|uniref:EPIDERMAL PATTERNING FACTOR-like protein 4 n=1 Tax=Silene latifolia TaxID=37657 RepID=UPI003D7884BA